MDEQIIARKKYFREQDQRWLENRLKVAREILLLSDNKTIDTTYDSQIIQLCTLNAISSCIWPGDRIDQKRFIQTLVCFGRYRNLMKRISVPALMQSPKLSDMSACIRDKFWPYPKGLVVNADDADLQESKLVETFPDLSIKEIRKCSYAHLLYADIRCGLVHSYELNERVTDWNLGIESQMQYRNINGKPTLFIPPDLITNIVKYSIESVFDHWLESEDYERKRTKPARWWIEGG